MKKKMSKIVVLGVLASMFAVSGCHYYGPCLNGSGADSFGVEVVAQENLLPMIDT